MNGGTDAPGDLDLDLALVLAEVHAEAERLRRSAPYGAELERQLDDAFRRHVPPDVDSADPAEALAELDALAAVSIPVPDAAPRPGRAEWKRSILRLVGRVLRSGPVARLMRMATSEVTAFNVSVVRFLRRTDARIADLEATIGAATPAVAAQVARIDPPPAAPALLARLGELVGTPPGRVVHLGCGRGELVRALVGSGRSAYGVDPARALHVEGLRDGLDLRGDDPMTHIGRLPAGTVGAVVVGGFVDRHPVTVQLEVLDAARDALVPGGRLIIALTDRSGPAAVAVDLLGGRPLLVDTWAHLVTDRVGAAAVEQVEGVTIVAATLEP